jgi:hypothetical protein
MHLPGCTAEASLYTPDMRYRGTYFCTSVADGGIVLPQFSGQFSFFACVHEYWGGVCYECLCSLQPGYTPEGEQYFDWVCHCR